MDCQAFDSALMDALYDELDAEASAAMAEHAESCDSCAARLASLKKTRALVVPALELRASDGFEARILAAADASSASRARADGGASRSTEKMAKANEPASNVIALARARRGFVIAFLSRPQLAIAASLLLVVAAAGLFLNTSGKRGANAAPTPIAMPVAAAPATPMPLASASLAAGKTSTTREAKLDATNVPHDAGGYLEAAKAAKPATAATATPPRAKAAPPPVQASDTAVLR